MSKPQAQDSTHFSWCPDGEHIVTATCSPRLRVSNGFTIWHYAGAVLHKQEVASGSELWEVRWQAFPDGTFPERPVTYKVAPSELGTTQATPKQAYRPPALRHLPAKPSARLVRTRPRRTVQEHVGDIIALVRLSARGGASSEHETWREGSVQDGAEEPEETRGQEGSQTGELLSANQRAPPALGQSEGSSSQSVFSLRRTIKLRLRPLHLLCVRANQSRAPATPRPTRRSKT